jgi:hypothetical protein
MSEQASTPRIVDGRWVITGPRVHGGMADAVPTYEHPRLMNLALRSSKKRLLLGGGFEA